jgi:prepilin-type N-terminal cleavage/methylation domain-containing protein
MPPARTSYRTFVPARQTVGVRGGFTLIELLAAITVLGILSSITIAVVKVANTRANIARARTDLAAFSAALEDYKRLYGDYPELGEFGQAPATPTGQSATLLKGTAAGLSFAQTKLFNCLAGVFGPRAFTNSDRMAGPNLLPPQFLDTTHLNGLNVQTGLPATFLQPVSNAPNPPVKTEQNYCILDPWGRRYLYYYKNARSPDSWLASGYVLYSAGTNVAANGTQTVPINPATGLLLPTQTAEMLDNIYANPP